MSRSRAESDASKQPSVEPSFARGERATGAAPKLDGILKNLAERALQATGASGVAIGLGRKGAMICRAAAGLSLPDLGATINIESGLTGAAVHRQMSQWCNDTESDSRVDVEVCRQLGVRSIIVVPIRGQDAVVGVLAIFSANPDAFSLSDLNGVKELAQGVTEAVENTVGSAAPRTTPPPAVMGPDHSAGKQPAGVNSERAHEVETKSYAVRIWRAILLALNTLFGIAIGRSVSRPTSFNDHRGG